MAYEVVQQVTVDVSRNLPAPVVFCKQADNVVRVLQVEILDNKQAYNIPDGFVARLRGTKSDGKRIYLDARAQTANTAEFVLTQNALAAYGRATCEVELSNAGGDIVKTCNLILNVQQTAMDDSAVESTDEFKSLETAKAVAETAAKDAKAAADQTAKDSTAAAKSAAEAKDAAKTATGARDDAQAAQKNAADSAAAATQAQQTAKDLADQAKTSADTAAGYAAAATYAIGYDSNGLPTLFLDDGT